MRRVSDLPSDRVPARARPAASRPPSPACPACGTPGPPREVRGRSRAQRGRAWVGRSARPRARGRRGVCVPARVRGRGRGCAEQAAGQGAGRASDPGSQESDGRTAGGHTRENPGRPRSAPTRREAARRLRRPLVPIACPQRPRSVQPSSKARQCQLCTPRTCHRCHTKKKKSFDLSFSDSSENPAPGTFSPVLFIQVVALLVLSEDMSSPSF